MSPRQLVPAGWHALRASSHELRLASTLENGQCFGWHRQACEEPVWVGVLGQRLLHWQSERVGAYQRFEEGFVRFLQVAEAQGYEALVASTTAACATNWVSCWTVTHTAACVSKVSR